MLSHYYEKMVTEKEAEARVSEMSVQHIGWALPLLPSSAAKKQHKNAAARCFYSQTLL